MTQITLYTAATPNGHKISVTLEELGLDYKAYEVDLQKAEQKEQWFLKINPNGRIPAIGKPVEKTEAGGWKVWSSVVDHGNGDLPVFESGAIMIYLAERYGNGNLLPKEDQARYEVIEWLMFQMVECHPRWVFVVGLKALFDMTREVWVR